MFIINYKNKINNMKENNQLRAQRRKNDEFYTLYENVADIFENYLNNYDFTNKIIYLPCDGEQSNFVKYLKENKLRLKYKDLIYTSDDFNTHKDLFNKADIIITNPPFSKLSKEFIPILVECKKDFFILGAKISLFGYNKKFEIEYNIYNIKYILPKRKQYFFKDNNDLIKGVPIIFITNIENIEDNFNKRLLLNRYKNNKYFNADIYGKDCLCFDKLKDVFITDEYLVLPTTVLFEHNKYLFNIEHIKQIRNLIGPDKKCRYLRFLCKIKDEYLK